MSDNNQNDKEIGYAGIALIVLSLGMPALIAYIFHSHFGWDLNNLNDIEKVSSFILELGWSGGMLLFLMLALSKLRSSARQDQSNT